MTIFLCLDLAKNLEVDRGKNGVQVADRVAPVVDPVHVGDQVHVGDPVHAVDRAHAGDQGLDEGRDRAPG